MSILNTSLSGMMANTNWLSTISQNVANANTTGYKNVDTVFTAMVNAGGNFQSQFAGVSASVRALNSLQGQTTATNTKTDLAVQGSGYFVVQDASDNILLTRNGSFVPDKNGDLVNASGYYLLGTAYNQASQSVSSLSSLNKVNVNTGGASSIPSTDASIVANLPSTATVVTGTQPWQNTSESQFTAETSLVAFDNLGAPHTFNFYFTKTGDNTWQTDVFDASAASTNGGFPYSAGPITSSTLTYSATDGKLTSGSPMSFDVPGGQTLTVDLTKTTQFASSFGVSSASINGNAPGAVTDVSIGQDGTLSFTYGNGAVTPIYRIPLAKIPSPDNLNAVPGNAFQPNELSGQPEIGLAGTSGLGVINSSSLEQSTVDLATELTEMVQAQSSYVANSKVFQAGAKVLDVLNNLQP